jgi:hypothetical protein
MSWSPCAEFDNGGAIPLRSLQSGPPHAIGSHATTMIALPKMMAAKMTASTSDTIAFSSLLDEDMLDRPCRLLSAFAAKRAMAAAGGERALRSSALGI